MPPNSEYLAVLFADITGSRQIYNALGDAEAQEFIADCLQLLSRITIEHQGRVIKTIGDEVMSVFSKPDKAAQAAIDMHKAMGQFACPDGLAFKPGIHIGFEAGMAVCSEKDVFGETVILASRLTSQAKSGQILTSGLTIEKLNLKHQALARIVDRTNLKGLARELVIYEIIWEYEDMTFMVERPESLGCKVPEFRIVHAGRTMTLDDDLPVITMGRHESCDIRIDEKVVSRIHASLERRREKIFLKDQSTNGTYVSIQDGKTQYVHRDETILEKSGYLGLGRRVDPGSPDAPRFFFT